MSNSNSVGAPRICGALVRRIVIGVLVLALPTIVWSGMEVQSTQAAWSGGVPRAKAEASKPHQRLRCWGHGQLLFDEDDLDAPSDSSSYVLKLRQAGGDRSPVYLVETKTATCLIQQGGAESSRAIYP